LEDVKEDVTVAINSDRFPGMSAPEILDELAEFKSLEDLDRLVFTMASARMSGRESGSLLGEIDDIKRDRLKKAFYLGKTRAGQFMDPADDLSLDHENFVDVLASARLKAWMEDRGLLKIICR
jgi:hypothetical protein